VAGEYYCRVFTEVYKLPTICLRYFNIYGPRQDVNSQYAAVIPRFLQDIQHDNSPTIFGDGEQTRDFTFVKDAVSANILAARNNVAGVFNIAQGNSVTIKHLAGTIMELLGKEIKPTHKEPRQGDIRHSLADINKAKTFGYKPEYDLRTGLAETIKSMA
jgi:UDP-glucose 4-epimerase